MWERASGLDVDMVFCDPDQDMALDAIGLQHNVGRPIVVSVLKSGQRPLPGTFSLTLPVKIGGFFSLLDQMEDQMEERIPMSSISNGTGGVAVASGITADVRETARTWLEALSGLIESSRSSTTRLSTPYGWIEIYRQSNLIRSSKHVDERFLREMLGTGTLLDCQHFDGEATIDDTHCESLERLIWLSCSVDDGQSLLPGLDHLAQFRLTQWPDFGVANEMKHCVELCAILSSRALTIQEMTRCTKLSVNEIRSFLNGCKLLEILTCTNAPSATTVRPPAYPIRGLGTYGQSGILQRIRGALRMFSH